MAGNGHVKGSPMKKILMAGKGHVKKWMVS
jgi:hypothetical protein